jgi:hypothetical protein
MDQILSSLRTLLIDHLAAMEVLSADAPLGSLVLTVPNTSRFRVGDQIYLLNKMTTTESQGETAMIADIPDNVSIVLTQPTSCKAWPVSESSYIQKAVNFQFIKRIHIGDLKVIPSFPTITIDPDAESNEWLTLQQTSHDYKFNIRAYVLADGFEKTNMYLIRLTQMIREVLIDHIRPIINGESHPLTVDLLQGQTVVTIADTSNFAAGDWVFIKDAYPNPSQQEMRVKKIISSTQLELIRPTCYDYLMSRQAECILVKRLLYDTRPDNITYGYVVSEGGGPLMRASQISWYAKENIYRNGNSLS